MVQKVPVAAFDLKQELAVQLQEVKASLQRDIQAATGHLGPALPSTPPSFINHNIVQVAAGQLDPALPSTPPPGSSFIDHEIADAIMASPPVVAPRYSRQERPICLLL